MPYRIFAYLSPRALGDSITFAWFVSSVAEMFDDSELVVYYRDDRPYKPGIIACIRNTRRVLNPTNAAGMFPIEVFDTASGGPNVPPDLQSVRGAHLILTHTMFNEGMLNSIPLATLAPPPETVGPSNQSLLDLGLDPGRWIATVYWKEAAYKFRPDEPWRSPDPAPYIAAIRHIIEDLGGQVVKLGHPTPTVLPKLKGLVDLAQVPNSHWLQLYAVWVSRFILGNPSGPTSYGPAFNVPTVITDQRRSDGVYRSHDYSVTQKCFLDGKPYQGYDAFAAGLLQHWGTDPRDYAANTAEELCAAADEMYTSTADCPAWRVHQPLAAPAQRPNKLSLPIPSLSRPELFIPPSRRRSLGIPTR
ncbi:MAG: hypothetical protein K1X51_02625 [Rhodospirillaceae bacterium]|nr:hypothetical protein [Rhodospirillaceae bacterium]